MLGGHQEKMWWCGSHYSRDCLLEPYFLGSQREGSMSPRCQMLGLPSSSPNSYLCNCPVPHMVLSMYRTLGHRQFVPQFVRIQATDIVGATSYCSFCMLMKVCPQGHLIGATELGEPPSFLFSKTELCLNTLSFGVISLQLPETLMKSLRFKTFISMEMIICNSTSVTQAATPLLSASKTYAGSQQNKFRENPPFLPSSKPKATQAIVTSLFLSLRTQCCKQPRVFSPAAKAGRWELSSCHTVLASELLIHSS